MTPGRWSIFGASVLVAAAALVAAIAPRASPSLSSAALTWIVFPAHPSGAAGPSQLFRVRTTGEGLEQITSGALPAVEPAFARRGSRLVFARLGSGIFAVDADGSHLRRLTGNQRDTYPVPSPDGKQIAFLRLRGVRWRVHTMDSSGEHVRRLSLAPPAGRPSWAPDAKSILIPSAGDLVRIDARTGRVKRYSGLTLDIQTGQTTAVSPDGRSAAFVAPRRSTGPPDCGEGRCQQFGLYLGRVAAPHRVRMIVRDAGAAGWSADGSTIAFVANGALTLRTVASGRETSVSTGSHVADGDSPPAWQPAP